MNRILTLLSTIFIINIAAAQQIAPDFTVTTVHGEEFNLYTELDKGKTIILDIFFVNCGPCNDLVPYIQDLNMKWGDGEADVEFISLTDIDTNAEILPYEALHSLTFPAAGKDGGGTEAVTPYISGTFGQFIGYPTLVLIAPDRTMNYDIYSFNDQSTADLLNAAIAATGATGVPLSVYESTTIQSIKAYPNPVINDLQVTFDLAVSTALSIRVMNASGHLVSTVNTSKLMAGEQQISIDLQDQTPGAYFIEVVEGDQLISSFNVVK